jgi:flagellar biosynthesis anti-sigma factor FlgM
MRIDSNTPVVPITKDTSTGAKAAPRSGPSGSSTVVTLSASATASASAQPVDVTSRLDRIRALLDKGDYPVDLDKLASRIVDDESTRGGTSS